MSDKLAVIIPFRNRHEHLSDFKTAITEYLTEKGYDFELIIVGNVFSKKLALIKSSLNKILEYGAVAYSTHLIQLFTAPILISFLYNLIHFHTISFWIVITTFNFFKHYLYLNLNVYHK